MTSDTVWIDCRRIEDNDTSLAKAVLGLPKPYVQLRFSNISEQEFTMLQKALPHQFGSRHSDLGHYTTYITFEDIGAVKTVLDTFENNGRRMRSTGIVDRLWTSEQLLNNISGFAQSVAQNWQSAKGNAL